MAGVNIAYDVAGAKDVIKVLVKLARKYGTTDTALNTLLPTIRGATKDLRTTIAAKTPRDTGKLAESVDARVFLNTRGYHNSATIQGKVGWFGLGAKNPRVPQARTIEFGSKFQRKRPVIVPALRQHQHQIALRIGNRIWEDILEGKKELEKLRKAGGLKIQRGGRNA